jgi:hypothetical protein
MNKIDKTECDHQKWTKVNPPLRWRPWGWCWSPPWACATGSWAAMQTAAQPARREPRIGTSRSCGRPVDPALAAAPRSDCPHTNRGESTLQMCERNSNKYDDTSRVFDSFYVEINDSCSFLHRNHES